MSDDRPEDEAERPAEAPSDGETTPTAAAERPAVERRAFLRQLTGEAVVTSGRLAGLSMAMRRGLFAAVESATGSAPGAEGSMPVIEQDAPAIEGPPSAPPAPADPPKAPVAPLAPAALSPRQEALLTTATSAVLGTNDAAGAPHLTSSRFHWDGTVVRLPSDLFAARVERIGADARVSLLVADDGPDTWVAINGTATVVTGDAAEAAMIQILQKDMSDEEAARSWTEMQASGNPVVIEVRPSRYLWRLG